MQVFMIGHHEDLHFIVQEYVPGQNLAQWFKRYGPPDFLTGLKWMKQVASALQAAAEAAIVHRDIKPENIMLTRSGDVKVTDFGLAQLNEPSQKMNLTQAGTTMGTPWYMSPEQIQGEPLDHRCDQYAFGVTCYHMFAGEPPFKGKNSVSVAIQHLKDDAPPLGRIRRDLPDKLCQLIHRMMAKQPGDRFESPEALLEAIQSLESTPINSDIVDTTSFSGWLKSSLPGGRMLIGGLLMCVIAGVVAGRELYRPVRLEVKPLEFPRETSAARQYAKAMLQPRNEAAWKAVGEYYPGTDEALWAQLQLSIQLLTKNPPDFSRAEAGFQKLYQDAAAQDESRKHSLQFLAVLGKALTSERQLQLLNSQENPSEQVVQKIADLTAQVDKLVYETLAIQYKDDINRGTLDAPTVLNRYYMDLHEDLRPPQS
ncbi:MAG: serine/threonine-protein kinase [Planctomycetaceae bacterium]